MNTGDGETSTIDWAGPQRTHPPAQGLLRVRMSSAEYDPSGIVSYVGGSLGRNPLPYTRIDFRL